MQETDIDAILLEKQRARKRINQRNYYRRHKHDPAFMARQYEHTCNYRTRNRTA